MSKDNLLAVRVEPWQLFRFRQWVKHCNSKPNIILQEALQTYFANLDLPREIIDKWLAEYHKEKSHETALD